MKTIFTVAFALYAAAVSAETPTVTEFQEIPAKYCGVYYLHEKTLPDVGWTREIFSPAKPFASIEARRITLNGGKRLKVTTIRQMVAPGLNNGQPQLIIHFEKTDFYWGISEKPDSKFAIIQTANNPPRLEPAQMQATIFLVSQKQ